MLIMVLDFARISDQLLRNTYGGTSMSQLVDKIKVVKVFIAVALLVKLRSGSG